ncbi:npl-a [Symbiodinium natans]|uniref:N-acetylneuraminate lyase n=1 Tax=Symbiodinium natans TaxID=878477 RepID=A0A812VHI4_9DINO|nr:npl-a [Symbiodinium natans]
MAGWSRAWLFLLCLAAGEAAAPQEAHIKEMVAAVFSPLSAKGSAGDLAIVPRYADMLVSKNVTSVLVAGTTGESLSLNVQERKNLGDAWAATAKTHGMKVYIHVGAESVVDTIALAQHAALTAGVAGLVCQTPTFFKPSVETLHDYLVEVGRKVPHLPLWYYHFPDKSGVLSGQAHLLLEMIHERKEIPNFAGIKFTDVNLMDFQLCQMVGGGAYNMLYGRDEQYLAAAALGADAPISSTVQFSPWLREVFRLTKLGKLWEAQGPQQAVAKLCSTFSAFEGSANVQKAVMQMVLPVGPSRLPYRDLSEGEASTLERDLRAEKLLDPKFSATYSAIAV